MSLGEYYEMQNMVEELGEEHERASRRMDAICVHRSKIPIYHYTLQGIRLTIRDMDSIHIMDCLNLIRNSTKTTNGNKAFLDMLYSLELRRRKDEDEYKHFISNTTQKDLIY